VEHWKSTEIILVCHQAGRPEQRVAVPCESVSWQPPSDMPPSRDIGTEPGYLLVRGVDAAPLADISWAPTHVRFSVEGYVEAREFVVTGWEADPDARTLKLSIP
jgi:hypothetical protein